MSEHVPNDLLNAFVEGEMDEIVAVHVAEHLDRCAHCATRAASLEPLASAFASCDDPPVPQDLAHAVMAALAQPVSHSRSEIAFGSVLLLLAASLAAATQNPVTLVADLAALSSGTQAVMRSLGASVSSFGLLALVVMVVAGAGAALTLRTAVGGRSRST